jgi:hypothetical protein
MEDPRADLTRRLLVALEGHRWLVAEVIRPDYRASRVLNRSTAERVAAWLLEAPRWRILDPSKIDLRKPNQVQAVLLEGRDWRMKHDKHR